MLKCFCRDSLNRSQTHLLRMGAIAESPNGSMLITNTGLALSAMPVDFEMGVSILHAISLSCSEEVAIIACVSAAAGGRLFTKNGSALNSFAAASGDHETYLNVYEAWASSGKDPAWCHQQGVSASSLNIADEMLCKVHAAMGRHQLPTTQFQGSAAARSTAILQSLCAGYFHQVATPADPTSAKTLFWLMEDFDVNPTSATLHRRSALYKQTGTGMVLFTSQTAYADGARVLCGMSKVEDDWVKNGAAGCGVSAQAVMQAISSMARETDTVAVTPYFPDVSVT